MGCGVSQMRESAPLTTAEFVYQLSTTCGGEIYVLPVGLSEEPQEPFAVTVDRELTLTSCCILKATIFFSGGVGGSRDFGRVSVDCASRKAELAKLPSMLSARFGHRLAVLSSNNLIALGSKQPLLSSCEQYSINERMWTTIAPMSEPRYGMGAAGFNGRWLFTFGGQRSVDEFRPTIECYDSRSDMWTHVTLSSSQSLAPRQGMYCVQLDCESILVTGGTGPNDTLPTYIFKPRSLSLALDSLAPDISLPLNLTVPIVRNFTIVYIPDSSNSVCYAYMAMKKQWDTIKLQVN
jgi:hypothetical protein